MNWLLGRAIITIGLNNRQFLSGLAQTQLRMLAFTSNVQSQANQMHNALRTAMVVGGVGGGVGGLTGVMLSAAAWSEQAEKALAHFMGSARAAKDMMREIEEFASETQFELPGATDAARKLLNVGVAAKDLIPTLRILADASAAVGRGQEGFDRMVYAISQIRGSGTLKATEMRQLTEVLVPAWEILSREMGVSQARLMQMVTNRQVSSAQAVKLLLQGMAKDYAGMTDTMLDTLGGKWGKFKDELFILFKELGEVIAPFAEKILDFMTKMTERAIKIVRPWGDVAEFVAGNMRRIFEYATIDIQKWGAQASAIVGYFTSDWGSLGKYMVEVFKSVFSYLADVAKTFFTNMLAWGQEWVVQFGKGIRGAFNDIRQGRIPRTAFEEFNPKTRAMPEFKMPELPRRLQNILDTIGVGFDAREKKLGEFLAEAFRKIIFPAEGNPREGRAPDDPLEDLRGKRKPEFLGLEELWRKRQLNTLDDPVVKAVKEAGQEQAGILNNALEFLAAIEENTGEAKAGVTV